MGERGDARLKVWIDKGSDTDDLLDGGIGLGKAATLLRDFGSSLSEEQIEYIQKSLAKHKRHRWVRDNLGLAAVAGLAVFAAYAGFERFNTERGRANRKQHVQPAQQNAHVAASQRGALETHLQQAEEKSQLAQHKHH